MHARTARLAALLATEADAARTYYAAEADRLATAALGATPTADSTADAAVALCDALDAGALYADATAQGYAWLCDDCAHVAAGILPGWALPRAAVVAGRLYAAWEDSAQHTDARGACDACSASCGGLGGQGRTRYDRPAGIALAPMLSYTDAAYALAEADATRHAVSYATAQAAAGRTEPADAPLSGEWADGLSANDLGTVAATAHGFTDAYAWQDADPDAAEAMAAICDAWETAYTEAEAWDSLTVATARQRTARNGFMAATGTPAAEAWHAARNATDYAAWAVDATADAAARFAVWAEDAATDARAYADALTADAWAEADTAATLASHAAATAARLAARLATATAA